MSWLSHLLITIFNLMYLIYKGKKVKKLKIVKFVFPTWKWNADIITDNLNAEIARTYWSASFVVLKGLTTSPLYIYAYLKTRNKSWWLP